MDARVRAHAAGSKWCTPTGETYTSVPTSCVCCGFFWHAGPAWTGTRVFSTDKGVIGMTDISDRRVKVLLDIVGHIFCS